MEILLHQDYLVQALSSREDSGLCIFVIQGAVKAGWHQLLSHL